jgi:hypothetical protein
MEKGENIVSIALAALVLLAVVGVHRRWNPASLAADVATSAEDFILSSAGIRGEVPEIAGYERLQTFFLGNYRAALYRATPAPLVFAPGRLVVYNRTDQPVFRLDTLEGSKDSWSALYDFTGRHGLPVPGARARPSYARDLSGDGDPVVVFGQYSGGEHCCTVVTVLELGKDGVTTIGRIDGIGGLPFEGLEIRKLGKEPAWQCIVRHPTVTACGDNFDAPDVPAIYSFAGGRLVDETANFGDYLQSTLRQNLAKWRLERVHTLSLLQTLAVDDAMVGLKDEAKRFFALNLSQFMPTLEGRHVDPNTCIDSLESLVDRLPVADLKADPAEASKH